MKLHLTDDDWAMLFFCICLIAALVLPVVFR